MTEIGHIYFMRPRKSLKAQGLFALEDSFLVHEIRIFRNMSSFVRRFIYKSSTILPLHVQLQKCFRHCSSFTWKIGIWHRQPVLTELWKCLEQRPQKLEGHFLASHLWFNLAHASESNSNKIILIDHQLRFFLSNWNWCSRKDSLIAVVVRMTQKEADRSCQVAGVKMQRSSWSLILIAGFPPSLHSPPFCSLAAAVLR